MCRCVQDIDILYDYYKRNMSLTEEEAIALYKMHRQSDNNDYKGALKDAIRFFYRMLKKQENYGNVFYGNIGKPRVLEIIKMH